MDAKGLMASLPWWVKWIAVPVVAIVIFGKLILTLVTLFVGLLFKVLILAAVVAGLIYVVRKFTSSSSSSGGGGGW